jgi:hypothetical protein
MSDFKVGHVGAGLENSLAKTIFAAVYINCKYGDLQDICMNTQGLQSLCQSDYTMLLPDCDKRVCPAEGTARPIPSTIILYTVHSTALLTSY